MPKASSSQEDRAGFSRRHSSCVSVSSIVYLPFPGIAGLTLILEVGYAPESSQKMRHAPVFIGMPSTGQIIVPMRDMLLFTIDTPLFMRDMLLFIMRDMLLFMRDINL